MARGRLGTWYDRTILAQILDRGMRGVDPLRAGLLAPARGRVIEIGFGTGSNLPFYASGVDELVAVEPSEGLASVARDRLRRWDRPHRVVVQSGARPLPFDAGSFDAVVITFVLCSARRVPELLAEARRIIKPGAPLLLAEHIVAAGAAHRACQTAMRPLWRACLGGCDPTSDPRPALRDAGFDASGLATTKLELPWLVSPGLVGVARAT